MKRALLVMLVACSTPPSPPHVPTIVSEAPATPLAPPPDPPPASAVVGFASRTRMIESRHGGEIKSLAVTPDGSAVLSVDDLGGTRLWPALDGTVEPRVVDLPAGNAIAIGPEPRGYVAASIDDAGGLTIAVIDRNGLELQRASLPAEPAFADLIMTSRGLLATRDDHTISRIANDGSIVERIAVGGGERIAAHAARGDKLLVQIEGEKRRLRWLLVTPSLQWGDWIPTKVEPEGEIAVSPRGTTAALAVGAATQRKLLVIELSTGAVIDGETIPGTTIPFDVAYADDDHIVIGARGATRVHAIDRKAKVDAPPASAPTQVNANSLAAGGERVIGSASAELAIINRSGKEYLGYEIEAPTVAATAPDGALLIGVGTQFAQLDKDLRSVATPDFKLPYLGSIAELRHVEDQSWLVEWANLDDGKTTAAFIDLATGARQELHAQREAVHAIGYDARSRLATFALGESTEVLRFDPAKKKFTRISGVKRVGPSYSQTALTPLDPAVANGNELLVATISGRLTLRWVPDARALEKGKALQMDGTFAAADPLGNVYVWQRVTEGFATVIYRDGKEVAKLKTDRPVAVAPDPKGGRYVEISQNEVSLVSHDGKRAWVLPVPGVNEVQWLTDGALALLGTGGLARVETATGIVQSARCGWRFGLSKTQHRSSSRVEPLCTRLR